MSRVSKTFKLCNNIYPLMNAQNFISDITTNMAPTTNQKPVLNMYVEHGNDIHLPCNIQGSPLPFYT